MAAGFDPSGRLPDVFTNAGTSSFTTFLSRVAPEMLPGRRPSAGHGRRPGAARDHHRGDLGRRWRGDGRRPTGHHGQPDRPARHREGAPRRRVLAGRHRGHRGHRHRADATVPGGAGALREDRGRDALARRQGQPAGVDDPGQPGRGHAGSRRRAAVRRLRPRRRRPGAGGADLQLRRDRWPVRGDRVRRDRLRLALRQVGAEEAFPGGPVRRRRDPARGRGALRRGRRRHRHRRTGP